MRKMRLHIVLVAFVIVLMLGFAGQKILYRQQVQKPLEKRFAAIEGVESVQLKGSTARQELVVTMGKVTELEKTYQQVMDEARNILGEEFDSIQLVDRRSPRLNEALHASHFAIEEGIATGYFTEMADEVAMVMESIGIDDYRLAVDETNVYLQMVDGENYLFSVFPRHQTMSAASSLS